MCTGVSVPSAQGRAALPGSENPRRGETGQVSALQ